MAKEQTYIIPYDLKPIACSGETCTDEIYWVEVAYRHPEKRTDGKTHYRTPVNPDGTSHWGNCPDREKFRKKKGGTK